MSDPFNLDEAVEHVKNLVDSLRCVICDKASGSRVSYPCGDSACSECAETARYCVLCLTPPHNQESTELVLNEVLSTRVKHATDLLNAFQDLFLIDVVKRKRISAQLKAEKELFPDCIQAPQTYHNKRKSEIINKSKENISNFVLPGEVVETSIFKMNKSTNYVKEWLDEHETELFNYKPTRKPFSDLEVNTPKLQKSTIKKCANVIINRVLENNENQSSTIKTRKRSHNKITLTADKNHKKSDNLHATKKHYGWKSARIRSPDIKGQSSINLDDETIVIEDSQSDRQAQDKDYLACLANANDNNSEDTASMSEIKQNKINNLPDAEVISQKIPETKNLLKQRESNRKYNRVPFYKRSKLAVPFNAANVEKRGEDQNNKFEDVSITIETKSFLTNINVNRSKQGKIYKHSKHVQTDFLEDTKKDQIYNNVEVVELKDLDSNLKSLDLFTEEPKPVDWKNKTKMNNSTVVDSSDSEHEQSSTFQVEVDVHKTPPDNVASGILTEIRTNENKKQRVVKRGGSPHSSNSSDKENRDPNSMKRRRHDKKSRKKNV